MSLEEYLRKKGIDEIADDVIFMEEEYDAIRSYCESHNYVLEPDDIASIRNRGLEESYEYWLESQREGVS